MDAVDPEIFARITRVPRSFERVLAGVRAAQARRPRPVKVNCVLLRGFNDAQIEPFAEFSRREGVIVRFIEFMPLEEDRTWKPETVVPMDEIVARLNAWRPSCGVPAGLVALPANAASETARASPSPTASARSASSRRSRGPSAATAAASASPPTEALRTCLFSQSDHDLYGEMLRGGTDEQLARI
jgi:cyclic pyranopterin phosphate synthase